MRVYNNANGDETMEHYYAFKPAYNAEADTQATVEFGGRAYSVYVQRNFYRLKVEDITV